MRQSSTFILSPQHIRSFYNEKRLANSMKLGLSLVVSSFIFSWVMISFLYVSKVIKPRLYQDMIAHNLHTGIILSPILFFTGLCILLSTFEKYSLSAQLAHKSSKS
jgi:hypothetical protein